MGVGRMEMTLDSKSLMFQWLQWSFLTLENSCLLGSILYGSHFTMHLTQEQCGSWGAAPPPCSQKPE